MITPERLKDLLSRAEYSRLDKILMSMAVDPYSPKPVSAIRQVAVGNGLTEAKIWNIADILARAKGSAIRTRDGWELTTEGRTLVKELTGIDTGKPEPIRVAAGLRHHLTGISEPTTREFVDQALKCYEADLNRAAVVLSWVGAVSVLQDHVLKNRLADFNNEARRRDGKWRNARNKDDLSRLKEIEFLNILVAVSVIGKSVKNELEGCLKLRNGCGHPNTLKVGPARVASHLVLLCHKLSCAVGSTGGAAREAGKESACLHEALGCDGHRVMSFGPGGGSPAAGNLWVAERA